MAALKFCFWIGWERDWVPMLLFIPQRWQEPKQPANNDHYEIDVENFRYAQKCTKCCGSKNDWLRPCRIFQICSNLIYNNCVKTSRRKTCEFANKAEGCIRCHLLSRLDSHTATRAETKHKWRNKHVDHICRECMKCVRHHETRGFPSHPQPSHQVQLQPRRPKLQARRWTKPPKSKLYALHGYLACQNLYQQGSHVHPFPHPLVM